MATSEGINLLKTKTAGSSDIALLERKLRMASFITLGIVCTVSVSLVLAYVFVRNQKTQLTAEKQQYTSVVAAGATKEAYVFSVKERVAVVGNVIASQINWAKVLGDITQIANPSLIASVSTDSERNVTVSVNAPSIEEAATMVGALMRLVDEKQAKVPRLLSLQLDKDGMVRFDVMFTPVF